MAAKKTSAATVVENVVVSATDRRSRAVGSDGAKRATSKRAAAEKATAKKAPAKKATPVAKTAAVTKAAPAKPTAKKASAKKASAKTASAKKAPAKTASAKKASAKKAPPAAEQKAPAKAPAKKATKAATTSATKKSVPSNVARLAVREDEKPWTAREIAEVTQVLEHDRSRLRDEIAAAEEEISHLLREGGEGAGHDQADVGSNTFERDHEMTMAKNARDNLVLVEEALQRIQDGTYGVCESCGRPIGKMRLQAFPRATLCLECKQRQERR